MKKYLYSPEKNDGFGAQYQCIIFTILCAEFNNKEFVYKDIKTICHNYDNNENHVKKLVDFMNLKNNYLNINDININDIFESNIDDIYCVVENNINIYTSNNSSMNKIKKCFWENKDKNHFKNDKINIAVHIRRPNKIDIELNNNRNISDDYYLKIINLIRNDKKDKELLFHIYSQGSIENFECYKNNDVVLHIDEEITSTFTGLVAADKLVTSASSFSYTAALLTDGEVYYLPFWHKPKKEWYVLRQ